jgi:hypothetical protein
VSLRDLYERSSNRERGAVRPRAGLGRRDWIRTNDPHHVKVVL